MANVETIGQYNWTHVGKAWAIVGLYLGDGDVICSDCARDYPTNDDRYHPVFDSDEFYATCDNSECGRQEIGTPFEDC